MSDKLTSGRRQFLKTAAVASGAAGVALTTKVALAEDTTPAAQPQSDLTSAGYRVTPHIETYYRLARD